ncbi:S1/P1 Nuclease [Phenylobacterium sp. SCN 70-31]|uniref:S1/P1 Nuclease n=1 Tax=Phenylobacterium sp. SCN 70-31 TaxID=1660129 RepID=UPI00086D7DDB|nr:S1/P1 Nuclease [Phenylobacterium sp. SCN 70-31]ODT89576.1 MAG: S1/P1 Nuclease [Phenylobacterium sp. SCN 70-31]
MKRLLLAAAACAAVATSGPAHAWGGAGHRMQGQAAMRGLPDEVPAFLRTRQAALDVGELVREPDRSKGAGKLHDHDRDSAHFIDIDNEGRLLGGPPWLPLSATRADYETKLRLAGLDQWKAGYLPYSILDRYQQLVVDLAYWRVLDAAERNPKWEADRKWFRQDRLRREALILKGIGELGHFVGDGSQPLHLSVHYNGWGDYPNPAGYSTARLHGPFEGDLVRDRVRPADVETRMAPFRSCACPIEQRVVDYLTVGWKQVIPFYELEKAGGLRADDPRGPEFAAVRLAAGASELRDLIVEAWRDSVKSKVGWKPVTVEDVLAGKVDPYPSLYAVD